MALTINGKRTGAAAQIDRQMAQFEQTEAIRLAKLDFGDALVKLKRVDPEWEEWYDDDRNIPPQIIWLDRPAVDVLIRRIRDRIEQVTA